MIDLNTVLPDFRCMTLFDTQTQRPQGDRIDAVFLRLAEDTHTAEESR